MANKIILHYGCTVYFREHVNLVVNAGLLNRGAGLLYMLE